MSRVLTKKSTVGGKVPLPADLEIGELAVNTADAKLYTKHSNGSIVQLTSPSNTTYYDSKGIVQNVKQFHAVISVTSAGGSFTCNYSHVGFTRILNVQVTAEASGSALADRKLADIKLDGVTTTQLDGHLMSASSAGLLAAMTLVGADAGKLHITVTGV